MDEEKRILHLTIEKKWFDKIAKRVKKTEYREIKPYWTRRLFKDGKKKEYDEVHLRNGYNPDSPLLIIKWNGQEETIYNKIPCYGIDVSEIIEIQNHPLSEHNKEKDVVN